jgi:predicted DNA-binding transcriptional regulator AlpA
MARPPKFVEINLPLATPVGEHANDNWPLVMTRREATKMCRISVQTFDAWVRKGILPGPIPGTRRWSRSAIEQHLGGVISASPANDQFSPFEQWKRGNAH